MAIELENRIMEELGLGNGPMFFYRTDTGRSIRKKITEELRQKINGHHERDNSAIAPAYEPLIDTLNKIASVECDAYREFYRTWYFASIFQSIAAERGKPAAEKDRVEREKNAWKPIGYWPGNDCVITNTWMATSYIIAEHIHTARLSEEERRERLENLREFLELEYIKKEQLFRILTLHPAGVDADQMLDLGERVKYHTRDNASYEETMLELKEIFQDYPLIMCEFSLSMQGIS